MNRTFTPTNSVNIEPRRTKQTDVPTAKNECNVFEMMSEFRLEMKNELDKQIQAYKQLENKFIRSEAEIIKVQSILNVVQEKASKVDFLENKIKIGIEKNERLESRQSATNIKNTREATQLSPVLPKSFASTVKEN
ncbi:unnamed protein product [Parnassius apollo]|uniref:(apollo) hypothetical protein n=1 Tax=Parnassius apollo TaxID=110799 RepID=A0A8S3X9A4_PARAO|nr:unnamed protein product [Parnassius apollo]